MLAVISPNLQLWCSWNKDETIRYPGQRSRSQRDHI